MSYCSSVEPIRKVVTLARVPGVEAGSNYTTIEVKREKDGRGDHMRRRVKKRAVRRGA